MFSEHLFQQPPRRRGSDRRERVEAERPVSRRREAGTSGPVPVNRSSFWDFHRCSTMRMWIFSSKFEFFSIFLRFWSNILTYFQQFDRH